MNQINRRQFVGTLLAGAGAACAGCNFQKVKQITAKSPTDRVQLGRTGITCSFVGIGTGVKGWMRSSNHKRMGQEAFTTLIRHAYDSGINFFDVADLYGTHEFLRNALRGIPRDKYVIQSKLWTFDKGLPEIVTDAREAVDRFRRELDTDYIDSLLLHCTQKATWLTDLRPMIEQLELAKQLGHIRSHGTSCHTLLALNASAKSNWVEVQQARINHTGARMDGKPEQVAPVLKRMRAQGKAVVGMKIFGEGTFTSLEEREQSLRYVLGENLVDAMVIGFEKPEQIDESLPQIEKVLKDLAAPAHA